MNFCDMMCESVMVAGTMFVSARNAAFSAAVICVGVWPASRFRAFTKSMWEDTPLMYAVRASPAFPIRNAASALMNCNSA